MTPRDAELVAKVKIFNLFFFVKHVCHQVAGEQKRLDAKLEWLAAHPQLRKKYKRAVSEHNALLEDPEELVR